MRGVTILLILLTMFLRTQQVAAYDDTFSSRNHTRRSSCDNPCANVLLIYLHEVRQNLDYARDTMRQEKLTKILNSQLDELKNSLEEHSKALEISQNMFDHSRINLSQLIRLDGNFLDGTYQNETKLGDDSLALFLTSVEKNLTELELKVNQLKGSFEQDYQASQLEAINSLALYFKFRQLFSVLMSISSELILELERD